MATAWQRRCTGVGAAAACVMLCWACLGGAAVAAPAVELVVGSVDAPRSLRIAGGSAQTVPLPASTPLGSLWKLFVYAYLVGQDTPSPDYQCTGRNSKEEAYCCTPGERVDRDAALAKSCGLYFQPTRLGIDAPAWSRYWLSRESPAWLADLRQIGPTTEVPVQSLLQALAAIEDASRMRLMRSLQRVMLQPRSRAMLAFTGAHLRVKTWSWHDASGSRIGGFAGWLADGTPIWLRASGTSATVMDHVAPWITEHLPSSMPADDACVSVRFFTRYPLAQVMLDEQEISAGALRGRVEVAFRNGQRLLFTNAGDMRLIQADGQRYIEGRFGLNDYVARVIQREASGEPVQAARALGVAVRTYLARHADFSAGCYRMNDDSRTQRVSPHAPDRAASAAAAWSDGLLLQGVDGRYHKSLAKPGQLAWGRAVAEAHAGKRWDEILMDAYGTESLGLIGDSDAGDCQPLVQAETWLESRAVLWRRHLQRVPGFEEPRPRPRVCRLRNGNPYADLGRGRIYAYGIASENDRLTIAHEYLHFGLAHHPQGRDEDFVERLARQLMGVP